MGCERSWEVRGIICYPDGEDIIESTFLKKYLFMLENGGMGSGRGRESLK